MSRLAEWIGSVLRASSRGRGAADEARPRAGRSLGRRRPLGTAILLVALVIAAAPVLPEGAPGAAQTADAASGLIFTQTQIRSRPMSGTAWNAMKAVAQRTIGKPDLADINDEHSITALAAALVFARSGTKYYKYKARRAIMDSIGSEVSSGGSAMLGVARNLGSIVLAADLINLKKRYPADDKRFRTWLSAVRTKRIGSHSIWYTLVRTHANSANNWGAFAGASRIAASRYLGDTTDVARAARIFRGFMGERSYYKSFHKPDAAALSWSCGTTSNWRPITGKCTKKGHNLSGAIIEDVSRGGSFSWPPQGSGVTYTMESLQGLLVQAELLQRAGYKPYTWGNKALRRAASFVSRYSGWNPSTPSYHVPWILNARYGLKLPTKGARYGRLFGFTDWLYGRSGLKVA
jgi:hypothetical protein